ncbi:MAG: dicarboxylate/amino acid:cation symporter [Proteobacteria bacterium]|nr:dicarboxylate/amino acid:cation symporter [Pseudomonadota bacterium]
MEGDNSTLSHPAPDADGLALADLLSRLDVLVRTKLWAQILAAMVLGVGIGLLLAPSGAGLVSEELAIGLTHWIALPGKLFLALIEMVVIPLVVSSVIVGINSTSDPAFLAKVGLRIGPYFVATTLIAVTIGVVVALVIEPGMFIDSSMVAAAGVEEVAAAPVDATSSKSVPDVLLSLVPTHVLEDVLAGNMLKIVIAALIFGVALVTMPREQAAPLLRVMDSLQRVAMTVVGWAMMLAPYAVFGLLCDITIRVGLDAILGMGVYVGTVLLGLLVLLVVYLGIVFVLGRMSPMAFLGHARDAQLLAFSTSSSAAVMPLSIETAEARLGVRPAIAKFVIPLGATVNMDGTALYQVVAAIFLMQVYGIDVTPAVLAPMIFTTVAASIGSPSTPGVGIVILSTILASVGVPAEGVALIIGTDRILDMARTTVNVTGDLTACAVMNHWLADPTNSPDPVSNAK